LIKNARFSSLLTETIRINKVSTKRLRVDLYVPGIVAIEIHGEQHEQEVRFSNEILDTQEELQRRQLLDSIKAECLRQAGVPFITIWYYEIDKLTVKKLRDMVFKAQERANKVPQQHSEHVHIPTSRTTDKWPKRKIKGNRRWPKGKRKWRTSTKQS
jgi:hypothetical protein